MDIRISQYILESGICLLVFYGIYYFWLKKETFFQLNRGYLLATAVLSVLIPLAHWSLPAPELDRTVQEQVLTPTETQISTDMPGLVRQWHETQPVIWAPIEQARPASILTVGQLLWLIYAIGIAIMAFRFLQKFSFLHRLIRQSKKQNENGYTLVKTKHLEASSFMGYIFWHEDRQDNPMILEHELVHIRQRHSLDILLMEMLVIFLWFNPVIYWFRNSLKEVHEFIADQAVAQKHSAYDYACLLVQSGQQRVQPQLFNTFNSFIKNRLLMLHNQPSSNWRLMKYLIFMPILAALIILFTLDFSKKLPEEVTQPFETAGEMMGEVQAIQVLRLHDPTANKGIYQSNIKEKTAFQVKWGDLLCDCFPEKENTPNYFICESLSIEKEAFLKSKPFQLLKNGTPVDLGDFRARTKENVTLATGDVIIFEGEQFDSQHPYFQAIKTGEVIKFNFKTADHRAGFFFHVKLIDKNQPSPFIQTVSFGNHQVFIDPMTNEGRLEVDYTTYKKMLNQPISLQFSNQKITQIDYLTLASTHGDSRLFSGYLESSRYKLRDLVLARDAQPGSRLSFTLRKEGSSHISVELKINKETNWNTSPPELTFMLGEKVIEKPKIYLPRDEWPKYEVEEFKFLYGGKPLSIKSVKDIMYYKDDRPFQPAPNWTINKDGNRELLAHILDYFKNGGDAVFLGGIALDNGLVYSAMLSIVAKSETRKSSAQKSNLSHIMDEVVVTGIYNRKYTIINPGKVDLKKLISTRMTSQGTPLLLFYGKEIHKDDEKESILIDHEFSDQDILTIYPPLVVPDDYPAYGKQVGIIEIRKKTEKDK